MNNLTGDGRKKQGFNRRTLEVEACLVAGPGARIRTLTAVYLFPLRRNLIYIPNMDDISKIDCKNLLNPLISSEALD